MSFWLSVGLGLLSLGLDRLHKFVQLGVLEWLRDCPPPERSIDCPWVTVAPFFDYVLVWNTGVSYGLMTSVPAPLLLGVVAAAMILLAVWWARTRSPLTRYGLAFCLGGALSNAVDRWVYGAVADFFHFHLGDWSFYIFNLADASITIGVVLLAADALRPVTAKAR